LFNFSRISKRIKVNEGYKSSIYKDQLGNLTIGYGHLINQHDFFVFDKKYSKKTLTKIFYTDLKRAILDFKSNYFFQKMPNNVQEVLIEMIFQLGIKNVLSFKKFNNYIVKKLYYLAALEMMDSLWYQQTPKRVNILINVLINNNAKKNRK